MEFNHINGRASGPLKNKSFTRPTSSSKRSSLLQPSPNFSDRISLGETCEPTVPSFIFSPSPIPPFSTGFRVWKPFPLPLPFLLFIQDSSFFASIPELKRSRTGRDQNLLNGSRVDVANFYFYFYFSLIRW